MTEPEPADELFEQVFGECTPHPISNRVGDFEDFGNGFQQQLYGDGMFDDDLFWDLQADTEANGAPDNGGEEERARGTMLNVAAAAAGDDDEGAATWIQHLAEHGPAGVVSTPRATESQNLCTTAGAEQRVSGDTAVTPNASAAAHSATDPTIGLPVNVATFGHLAAFPSR